MNDIKTADFLLSFPPALKKDEKMLALGRLVAEELHISAWEAEKNVIYANIDSLSETWLDVLAYDLHVDWYDYDYPIEAKRAIIKDSVRVHQKLGTKAAVERALGGIHPQSEIEEWFSYNGKPYCFRIVLDTTNSRVAADYDEIVKTVDIYKRLTAHLDGLYYQCSICVVVMPHTAVKGRHRAVQKHGGGGRKCGYQYKRKGSRVYSRSREDRHEAGQKYSVFYAG